MRNYKKLTDSDIAKVIVRLAEQEIERVTRLVIEAEAEVAAQQVRVTWVEHNDDQGNFGQICPVTNSKENLRRLEMARDSAQDSLYEWKQVRDYAINTFLNKIP
jgi:hypothetical protein